MASSEQCLCSATENFVSATSREPADGNWNRRSCNFLHGGVLLEENWVLEQPNSNAKHAAFFNYIVHNFRLYLFITLRQF